MPYKLAEYHGDTLAVPQLVVSHLTQTDGDTIRAALYLLQTGDTDPRTMARALGLSSVEAAKRALPYWAGAGLLVNDRGGAPIPEPEKPQKIDLANLNDPYVAVLCEEAQTAFGKALSRSEMQRLVGLYLTDGWQPDVILPRLPARDGAPSPPLRGNLSAGGRPAWRPARMPSATCAAASSASSGVPKPQSSLALPPTP